MLENGTRAPEFALKNKDGQEVKLSDYLGKKVSCTSIRETIRQAVPVRHVLSRMHIPRFESWAQRSSESARIPLRPM